MSHLLYFVIMAAAMLGLSRVLPGFKVDGWAPALIASLVLALVNTIVKPILFVLTLPLTIVTLGLFLLVLNALLLLFVGWISSELALGLTIDGFVPALLGSIVISLVSLVLSMVLGTTRRASRAA